VTHDDPDLMAHDDPDLILLRRLVETGWAIRQRNKDAVPVIITTRDLSPLPGFIGPVDGGRMFGMRVLRLGEGAVLLADQADIIQGDNQ